MKYLFALFISILSVSSVFAAQEDYTLHNTTADCYVRFEDSVYDLTDYMPSHDRFMNIRDWCGKDMTEDFKTKAGEGVDHRASSYALLEKYKLYDIQSAVPVEEELVKQEVASEVVSDSPYNLVAPLLLSLGLYWIPYFIIKVRKKSLLKFNAFFNTILLLTLLIPAFGFGVFMMLRYQFPGLYEINFDFMYWHVELSLIMGVLGINHLLARLKIYLMQIKK